MRDSDFKADIYQKTAAEWTAIDPFLSTNDLGIESDTGLIKVGVGQRWSNTTYLPSAGGGGWTGSYYANIMVGSDYYVAEFTVTNGLITNVELGEPILI